MTPSSLASRAPVITFALIVGANFAGKLTEHFGAEPMILFGSALSTAGLLRFLAYRFAGRSHPVALCLLIIPTNVGLGFLGPPGFYRAVLASKGGDALVLAAILATTAGGTAAAAPFVTFGIVPLVGLAAAVSSASVACLPLLPKLGDGSVDPEQGLTVYQEG
jgi:hypothetical protein